MHTTGSSSIAIRNSNSCNEEDGEEMHRKNGSANALYRNCERGATSSRTQGLVAPLVEKRGRKRGSAAGMGAMDVVSMAAKVTGTARTSVCRQANGIWNERTLPG